MDKLIQSVDNLLNQNNLTNERALDFHGMQLWKSHNPDEIEFEKTLVGFPQEEMADCPFKMDLKGIFYSCIMQSNVPKKHRDYIHTMQKMLMEASYDYNNPKTVELTKLIYLYVPYIYSLDDGYNIYEILKDKLSELYKPMSINIDGTVCFTKEGYDTMVDLKLIQNFCDRNRISYFELNEETLDGTTVSCYTYDFQHCHWNEFQYVKS